MHFMNFFIFALITQTIAFGSYLLFDSMNKSLSEVAKHNELARLGARIHSESLMMTELAQKLVLDPNNREQALKDIAAQQILLTQLVDEAHDSISNNEMDESLQLANISQLLIGYNSQSRQVIQYFETEGIYGPKTQASMEILLDNYQGSLNDSLKQFEELEASKAQEILKDTSAKNQYITRILSFLFLASSAILIVAIYQVVRRFVRPLSILTEGVSLMQTGVLDKPISLRTEDEMGRLANVLNNMARELNESKSQLEKYAATLEVQVEERTHELKRLATIDSLTEIYNRRYFFALAERAFAESARYGYPISAIMIDADHFKNINDIYGHATGDEVLKRLVKTIGAQIRDVDIFGRYGGEEFMLILPHISQSTALQIAERICASVKQIPFEHNGQPFKVTISVGVAERNISSQETLAYLLHKADKAMYKAKQIGRNRICAFDSTIT